MTVFLVGGGPETVVPGLLAPFLAEVTAAAVGRPRVALLLCGPGRLIRREIPAYRHALDDDAVDLRPVRVPPGRPVPAAALAGADGIVVGGGATPDYLAALAPVAAAVASAVAGGTPYLGLSAGAMVAARSALAGGHSSAGRDVCPPEESEGLGPVTVVPGLGLVGFTVDVHTGRAGTLARTVDLVTSGSVATAVGIDEDTCLAVADPDADPARCALTGSGNVWTVRRGSDARTVTVTRASA